jgi:hypothetical protein
MDMTEKFLLSLCYPEYVAALRGADTPSKETYQLSVIIIVYRLTL